MCISAGMMQLGGNLLQGYSAMQSGRAQNDMARADAKATEDAAAQDAKRILRETARRKGAARAATAASGTRLDEFALGVEQEIDQAGQTDAAMTILGGKRRADALRLQGKYAKSAGMGQFGGSLIAGAYQTGNWRGTKGTRTNDISGATPENAYEKWLRSGVGGD